MSSPIGRDARGRGRPRRHPPRTLFETWLNTIYVHLGGDDAFDRIDRNNSIQERRNAKRLLNLTTGDDNPDLASMRAEWNAVIAEPEVTGELDVAGMAERVRKLLETRGEQNSRFPTSGYAAVYGPESYASAHGGLGALDRYIVRENGQAVRVSGDPWEHLASGHRLDIMTSVVGVLATHVARAWQLDFRPLNAFMETWLGAAPVDE